MILFSNDGNRRVVGSVCAIEPRRIGQLKVVRWRFYGAVLDDHRHGSDIEISYWFVLSGGGRRCPGPVGEKFGRPAYSCGRHSVISKY